MSEYGLGFACSMMAKVFVMATFCVIQSTLLGCTSIRSAVPITTNQQYIEQSRADTLDLENIPETFKRVFESLPDEVVVYPTENYYYFKLFANQRELWGNLRLDSHDRDKGLIDFAYFQVHGQTHPYFNHKRTWHKQFGKADNVIVLQRGPLEYAVTAHRKTVLFKLNPLEQKIPPGMRLRHDEEFVSRICDESGFQFVLLFDRKRKAFRYVLDESVPLPDQLLPFGKDFIAILKDVFVGVRSGFAFYREPDLNRKLLFGVDRHNMLVNNYYDGPFDQLADNFVDEVKFEQYLNLAYPSNVGKMKGRGDFVDEKGAGIHARVAISPYFSYDKMSELWTRVMSCQKLLKEQDDLSACIGRDLSGDFSRAIESKLADTFKPSSDR
jgi:hypothetical protein